MTKRTDAAGSIEEIEGVYWGDPPADATRLIATGHRLRRKPLGELSIEDLRFLIGQQIGVPILVPRALEILDNNPLAEGDMFDGDLLCAVLRVDQRFWAAYPALAAAVEPIVSRLVEPPPPVDAELARWRAARHVR